MNDSIRKLGENIKNCGNFKGQVLFDEPMKNHTTMKVGGAAEVFVLPQDQESCRIVLEQCYGNGINPFILGGGSNLVVNDQGIQGIVLCTESLNKIELIQKDGQSVLCCGSGTLMDQVADFCGNNGLSGMETFSGLPGTCGGACYMNARCYEKNISDVLNSVTYLDLDQLHEGKSFDSCIREYLMDAGDWDYKLSPFQKGRKLVLQVCFKVCSPEGMSLEEARALVCSKNASFVQDRKDKGHFKAPSAGSVFKNNRSFGKPSGKLVDEAGLKGTAVGGAQISSWHGNFIINNGNATASDIKALVDLAIEKVRENTGFVMEPEIIFV